VKIHRWQTQLDGAPHLGLPRKQANG